MKEQIIDFKIFATMQKKGEAYSTPMVFGFGGLHWHRTAAEDTLLTWVSGDHMGGRYSIFIRPDFTNPSLRYQGGVKMYVGTHNVSQSFMLDIIEAIDKFNNA